MTITITDGYTLNPGDLSWAALQSLGTVQLYDRTHETIVVERCRYSHVIVTNKTPIRQALMDAAKNLKMIAVTATGYNVVDVAAAARRGIPVMNVPVYGTDSVAQHTFALILELTNQVGLHAESVRRGVWSASTDWCYAKTPLIELRGKILGIVGYGRIGQQTARIAAAFGMEVIYYSRHVQDTPGATASLEELFQTSDIVSLHCPLTPANTKFVNQNLLARMKPSAFLINTSRGQLIDETALAEALLTGRLAGAALDVLSSEPPPQDHPLLQIPNCMITPHNAWLSFEARRRIMETTYQNIKDGLDGVFTNAVKV